MTPQQRQALAEMREAIGSQNASDDVTAELAELAGLILTAHAEHVDRIRKEPTARDGSLFSIDSAPDLLTTPQKFAVVKRAYAMLVKDGWVEERGESTWTWTPDKSPGDAFSTNKYQLTKKSAGPLFGKN